MRLTHAEFAKLAHDRGIKIDNPLVNAEPDEQSLTVPYPPSMNHYWNPVVVNGRARIVLGKEGRAYKQTVANIGLIAKMKIMTGKLVATIVITAPDIRCDADNCLKALFDSLIGIMYEDDRQVYEIHAYKRIQRPGSVSITVKRQD